MTTDIATLGLAVDSRPVVKASQDLDGLAQSASRAERGAEGFETAAQKMSNELSSMLGPLGRVNSLIGAMVGALAGLKLFGIIRDATELSARIQTLGVVMHQVGRVSGYTTGEINAFEQRIKTMGITTSAARQTVIKLAQAQVDLSNASKLARVAQDAAVIGNVNSSEALDRMIHGIQSAQIEVLRTIGLQVNFENSYKALADEMGKSVMALTEQEKAQARVNSVMEAGKTIVGSYEASLTTANKQLGSTQRYIETIQEKLGDLFLPAYTAAVFAYSDALKFVMNNFDGLADAAGLIIAVVGVQMVTAMGRALVAQNQLNIALITGNASHVAGAAAIRGRAAAALVSARATAEQTNATYLSAQANVAFTQSEIATTRALIQTEIARKAAQINNIGRLERQREIMALRQIEVVQLQTLTAHTQALTVAQTANAAAMGGVAAATTANTAALAATTIGARAAAVAMKGLNTVLAFFGGPVGAAITAVGVALLYLSTRMSAAEEAANSMSLAQKTLSSTVSDQKKSVDELSAAYSRLSREQRDLELFKLNAALRDQAAAVDASKRALLDAFDLSSLDFMGQGGNAMLMNNQFDTLVASLADGRRGMAQWLDDMKAFAQSLDGDVKQKVLDLVNANSSLVLEQARVGTEYNRIRALIAVANGDIDLARKLWPEMAAGMQEAGSEASSSGALFSKASMDLESFITKAMEAEGAAPALRDLADAMRMLQGVDLTTKAVDAFAEGKLSPEQFEAIYQAIQKFIDVGEGAFKKGKSGADDFAKSLAALRDDLNPVGAATRKFAADMDILNKAGLANSDLADELVRRYGEDLTKAWEDYDGQVEKVTDHLGEHMATMERQNEYLRLEIEGKGDLIPFLEDQVRLEERLDRALTEQEKAQLGVAHAERRRLQEGRDRLREYEREVARVSEDIAGDVSEALWDSLTDERKGQSVLEWFKDWARRLGIEMLKQNIILPVTAQLVGSMSGAFGIETPAGAAGGQGGVGGSGLDMGTLVDAGKGVYNWAFGGSTTTTAAGSGFTSGGMSAAGASGPMSVPSGGFASLYGTSTPVGGFASLGTGTGGFGGGAVALGAAGWNGGLSAGAAAAGSSGFGAGMSASAAGWGSGLGSATASGAGYGAVGAGGGAAWGSGLPSAAGGGTFGAGLSAAPWGIVGSLGASALGLGSGNAMIDGAAGMVGSIGGGMAGSAMMGAQLGAAAGPIGAAIGAFIAIAASTLLKSSPTNAAAGVRFDPRSGEIASASHAGKGNSEENLKALTAGVVPAVTLATQALTRAGVVTRESITSMNFGNRDTTSFGLSGGAMGTRTVSTGTVGDPVDLVGDIIQALIDGADAVPDAIAERLHLLDFSDPEGLVASIEFIGGFEDAIAAMTRGTVDFAGQLEAVAKQEIAQATDAVTRFQSETARLGLDTQAAADATRAYVEQLVGLREPAAAMSATEQAVAGVHARFAALTPLLQAVGLTAEDAARGLEKALGAIAEGFDTAIAREITAKTDPTGLALRDLGEKFQALRREAVAVGGSLDQVHRLYALEQAAITAPQEAARAEAEQQRVQGLLADVMTAYESQAQGLQTVADAMGGAARSLREAWLSLALDGSLSPLSPEDRMAEAERQYNDVLGRAKLGSSEAMGQLPEIARSYLEVARGYRGDTAEYSRIFDEVTAALQDTETVAARHARIADEQLSVMRQQLDALGLLNTTALSLADALAAYQAAVSPAAAANDNASLSARVTSFAALQDQVSRGDASINERAAAYLRDNPDVAADSGFGSIAGALRHFMQHGQYELRGFSSGGTTRDGELVKVHHGELLYTGPRTEVFNARDTDMILGRSRGRAGGSDNKDVVAGLRDLGVVVAAGAEANARETRALRAEMARVAERLRFLEGAA